MPIDKSHSLQFPSFQLFVYVQCSFRTTSWESIFDDEMPITIHHIQNGTIFFLLLIEAPQTTSTTQHTHQMARYSRCDFRIHFNDFYNFCSTAMCPFSREEKLLQKSHKISFSHVINLCGAIYHRQRVP